MDERERWDRRYREAGNTPPQAAAVLREHLDVLPRQGKALDLAAGLGGNALLLAEQGLDTYAWDISPVAMERLKTIEPKIHCEARDVTDQPPTPGSFDVIVISRFLDRDLCPAIERALRPGGVLFYQTFTVDSQGGPRNPAFLLQNGELPALFPELGKVVYREMDGEAFFVGRK